MSAGTFSPRPGAATLPRMLVAQAAFETRLLLRNGEQVLLTLVVPLGVLLLLALVPVVDTGAEDALGFLVPGVLALSVMSTAFTSLAIATGYERRYGVLKRLAASPLPRGGLLGAKALSVLAVIGLQAALVALAGYALGWRPAGDALAVALLAPGLVLAGTAAFAGLGLLMAGTLRAEATLAGANLVYLVLLVGGGVVVPLSHFPEALGPLLELSPAAALAEGLRAVLSGAGPLPVAHLGVLGAWAALGLAAAARTFRWE